jgi:hypothetical protein
VHSGTLVEGVVDLAFREETSDFAGWSVVDFKTDSELKFNRDGTSPRLPPTWKLSVFPRARRHEVSSWSCSPLLLGPLHIHSSKQSS